MANFLSNFGSVLLALVAFAFIIDGEFRRRVLRLWRLR
jgi:hypothetical protein